MKKFILLVAVFSAIFSGCGEKTTPNGYQFVTLRRGNGPSAKSGDYGIVHAYIYQNDSLIASTRQMRQTVPVQLPDFSKLKPEEKGPGKGNPLADALSVMKVGDSIVMTIPITEEMKKLPEMHHVKSMTWHVVLMDVKSEQAYQEEQHAKRREMEEKSKADMAREPAIAQYVGDYIKEYRAGNLNSKITTTPSGLKYTILEQGSGKKNLPGDDVQVHYYGALANGKMFDNSFARGTPFSVQIGAGRVIKGWDEGLALLKRGDKALFFIPPALGYGAGGAGDAIPPNAELIFYIEVLE